MIPPANRCKNILSAISKELSQTAISPEFGFRRNELDDLRRSIEEQGIIQPLLVRDTGSSYELIAGERRFRAAKMAGLVKGAGDWSKKSRTRECLSCPSLKIFNGKTLNPIEEAEAYYRLMKRFQYDPGRSRQAGGEKQVRRGQYAEVKRHLPDLIKNSITDGYHFHGTCKGAAGCQRTLSSKWPPGVLS